MQDNGPRGQRPRLLVVNDDRPILELVQTILTDEGYEVETRQDWSQAYDDIKQSQPDLVIMDLRMGDAAEGLQALEALKRDPATRHIRILVFSADPHLLNEHQASFQKYGIATLRKPFELEELLAAVRRALAS